MTESVDDTEGLSELLTTLWSLREYLPQLTLIGGWVPELYRRYAGFSGWSSGRSRTREADILIGLRVERGERPTIAQALRSAGFRPIHQEPMPAVWLSEKDEANKIEFLTGLDTPAMRQASRMPVDDQPGIGALALPSDLNLLERHSRFLSVSWQDGEAIRRIAVKVPELAAFVVNKTLTSRRRPSASSAEDKAAKDLLYIRDLSAAGKEVISEIARGLPAIAADEAGRRQVARAAEILSTPVISEVAAVAGMLVERDRISATDARADVLGHLHDVSDMLSGVLSIPGKPATY
jgi:hypothetical protein